MAEPEAKAVVPESVLKKGKRAELAKKKALDARKKKKEREIRKLSSVLQYLEEYETHLEDKMKAESYTDPLLNNRAHEVEYVSNFAFVGITMAYSVMYSLYAAFFRKKGGSKWVMIGLHIWTALLMLLLLWQMFIISFIRLSVGTLKVMRLVMSGLLLVSLYFILLNLSLFQSLDDEF